MANLDLSLVEDEIVTILDAITDVTGNVFAATIPDLDIEDVIHPPGILVAYSDEDLSTREDQAAYTTNRKVEVRFDILVVARTMRTDTNLGPGLHSIMAEVKDKLHGQSSAVSGVQRPYMLQSARHQRTEKESQKVGYIMEFDTLVIVKKQP